MIKRNASAESIKKKAPRKPSSQKPATQVQPPGREDQRRRWILEAAYYRAERRGFAPGSELDDWLAAEAEIDGSL